LSTGRACNFFRECQLSRAHARLGDKHLLIFLRKVQARVNVHRSRWLHLDHTVKRSVLIVEDHRIIREGMVQALAYEGFDSIPAANGQEALDYLRSGGHASVIVLDLTMPVMNGWMFRQQQQGDPRLAHIPTIVLSGTESRPFGSDTPAAILQKPVDLRMLLPLLEAFCDGAGRAWE
jgi:CheY-like chemotaxis protein